MLIRSAAFKGDVKKIREFLYRDNGLCNSQDNRGNTPIMFATMTDNADALAELLLAGADLNIKNKMGVRSSTENMFVGNLRLMHTIKKKSNLACRIELCKRSIEKAKTFKACTSSVYYWEG